MNETPAVLGFLVPFFFLAMAITATQLFGAETPVFGPVDLSNSGETSQTVRYQFESVPGAATLVLQTVGNASDPPSLPDLKLTLNGQRLIGSGDTAGHNQLEVPVELRSKNRLRIRLFPQSPQVTLSVLQNLGDPETTIGPDGGTLEILDPNSKLFGVKLQVPAGALSEATLIRIDESGEYPIPEQWSEYGPGLRIEPEDLVFHKPAQLTVPFSIPESKLEALAQNQVVELELDEKRARKPYPLPFRHAPNADAWKFESDVSYQKIRLHGAEQTPDAANASEFGEKRSRRSPVARISIDRLGVFNLLCGPGENCLPTPGCEEIRVFVDASLALTGGHPVADLEEAVQRAIERWNLALTRRIELRRVSSPDEADVLVTWAPDTIGNLELSSENFYRDVTGDAATHVDLDGMRIVLFHNFDNAHWSPDDKEWGPGILSVESTALFELGHVLGLENVATRFACEAILAEHDGAGAERSQRTDAFYEGLCFQLPKMAPYVMEGQAPILDLDQQGPASDHRRARRAYKQCRSQKE